MKRLHRRLNRKALEMAVSAAKQAVCKRMTGDFEAAIRLEEELSFYYSFLDKNLIELIEFHRVLNNAGNIERIPKQIKKITHPSMTALAVG